MFRHLVAPLVLLLMVSTTSMADSERRDGNWWRTDRSEDHFSYVLGIMDGMFLGNMLSYAKDKDTWTKNKKYVLDAKNISANYNSLEVKYFGNVTNIQICDGLNQLYNDYRNRRITVDMAIWLVVNQIAGKSNDDMEKMVESFRKNSQ